MKGRDLSFELAVRVELSRARSKFPDATCSMAALTEEVGELAQALLAVRYGKGTMKEVWEEAVQVAVMAQRVAVEGDVSVTPASRPSA